MNDDAKDVSGSKKTSALTVAQAISGPLIPAQQRILLYSEEDWEGFVHEWVHSYLANSYSSVKRFTGAGDRGIDVAGFTDAKKLQGVWDNYQCKHYGRALYPTDAWPEIGKVLWYSFNREYGVPRKYFFVAPWGCGTTLLGYLGDAARLKKELFKAWDKNCKTKITDTQEIVLDGLFLEYVDKFEFSIFDSLTSLNLIDGHRTTPHFVARFGGGLPPRPLPDAPPSEVAAHESRYVGHLLNAYGDHKKESVSALEALKAWPPLQKHFTRQREAFYHAENLRVFSRDSVPAGTYESLQQSIFDGVIDVHNDDHEDGYKRVLSVTREARNLPLTANALITCTNPKDRDGICHQLANEDRLTWKKPE